MSRLANTLLILIGVPFVIFHAVVSVYYLDPLGIIASIIQIGFLIHFFEKAINDDQNPEEYLVREWNHYINIPGVETEKTAIMIAQAATFHQPGELVGVNSETGLITTIRNKLP